MIDGDRFERQNAARQDFCRLGNKAEVKAAELAQEFEALSFRARRNMSTRAMWAV